MTNRTKRLAGRVTLLEHAEIMAFLNAAGLSLPDFVLLAVRSGQFKQCRFCGAVESHFGCPNWRAPYPQVKYRAQEWREYERDSHYFLEADGRVFHWTEDDI
jgi:hypothetical protein